MSDELAFLDATAQAELVRSGELAPAELVDAAIGRIERLNPTLNAVIIPLFEAVMNFIEAISFANPSIHASADAQHFMLTMT